MCWRIFKTQPQVVLIKRVYCFDLIFHLCLCALRGNKKATQIAKATGWLPLKNNLSQDEIKSVILTKA
jgi:hypothetical protein